MKTKKCYLISATMIAILCIPALPDTQLPPSLRERVIGDPPFEPGLIGQPNPTLAGLETVYVVIVTPDTEPNKDGLLWKELQAKVEQKLEKVGIKTTFIPEEGIIYKLPIRSDLKIYVDMLKLTDSQQYVFRIQTSLSRVVRLAVGSELSFKSDVWKTEPTMQAASVESMPAKVTDVVLEQVEAFICAYTVANPPDKQPADAKTTDTVSQAAKRQQAKPAAKPAVAKYNYAASKNSKVFHRPQCSFAGRIAPKNLVGYNTRQDAIRAGKRPCKICKP